MPADELPPFVRSLPLAAAAYELARDLHEGQHRKWDGAPFLMHPLVVAGLLDLAGCAEEVVAAGILHDIVEDTEITVADLEERFGADVARIVDAVSEDEDVRDYDERKRRLTARVAAAGPDARAVFAADKIAKVRELRAQIALAPDQVDSSPDRRVGYYRQSLRMLSEHEAEAPLVRQLRFELWALDRLPPRQPEPSGSG